jgi:hypothetical protein
VRKNAGQELDTIVDFLQRTVAAGQAASGDLD